MGVLTQSAIEVNVKSRKSHVGQPYGDAYACHRAQFSFRSPIIFKKVMPASGTESGVCSYPFQRWVVSSR